MDKALEHEALGRRKIERRALPWGKAEKWGSLCVTVFCELCTSSEARALSFSVLELRGTYRWSSGRSFRGVKRKETSKKFRTASPFSLWPQFLCSFEASLSPFHFASHLGNRRKSPQIAQTASANPNKNLARLIVLNFERMQSNV